MDDMKQDFSDELRNVIKIEKIEWSPLSETPDQNSIGQIFQSILSEKTEKTSQEQVHSASKMDDMKQDVSDELRNVKIERKECSPRSDTSEHSSTIGQTFEFVTSEKTKISEEPILSRSIMNDLKQDVTNDLKNVIKIEKNESSSDTETSEYSSTSQSLELFLADETQKKENKLSQEMIFHCDIYPSNAQDVYARNTPYKDLYAGNLKDQGTNHSNENKLHQLIDAGKQANQSQMCTETFCGSLTVKNNEMMCSGKKTFQCKICQKAYTQSSSLKRHETTHCGKPLKCKICQKEYTQHSSLKYHEITHYDKKPFQCKICHKKYTLFTDLKCHEAMHSGKEMFKCDICHKLFTQSFNLKRHVLIHSDKRPFQCKICLKAFTLASSLKRHEVLHFGKKKFKCEICLKEFTQAVHLKSHERIHSDKKPFQCKICQKEFSFSSGLKHHEVIHFGQKPFKCEICQKEFFISLKRQKLFHSNQKSFQCKTCQKEFTLSSSLKSEVTNQSCHENVIIFGLFSGSKVLFS
ncbi:zinc finger protein 525 [Biomphalaria glabrata]|nr:zinc finger protein 525-like [Biomphalaria glabrata]